LTDTTRRLVVDLAATSRNWALTPAGEARLRAEALRAYGIMIESARIFDHSEDRTFEVKLAGPSRLFDIAEGELLGRDFILSVTFD